MRRAVEELRADLVGFIEQREALVLVLWAKSPLDNVYPFKLLEAMEQTSQRDLILLYTHDCFDASRYVDSIVASLDMEIDEGNEAIAQRFGDDDAVRWEPLPPQCHDGRRSPVERIRALVEHIRRYYPDPAHRIVLGLLPSELSSPEQYAAVVLSLVPRDGYEPWMAGVRIVACDTQSGAQIVPALIARDAFGTLVRPIDFSTNAMTQALVDTMDDTSAPVAERMAAFVQVAALDHAWGRHDEAIAKYAVAHRWYLQERNEPMRGICILHAGYAYEQSNRLTEAQEKYLQALELAVASDIRQLILNAMMALASLHQRRNEWAPAAQYWEGAAFVAKALQNPHALADCTEHAGVCQVALNDEPKALALWDTGKQVAQQVGYWTRAVSLLEHLVAIERRAHARDAAAVHERELVIARDELNRQNAEVAAARRAARGGPDE